MPAQEQWIATPETEGGRAPQHHRFARTALLLVVLVVLAAIGTVVGVRQLRPEALPAWPAQADQAGASTCLDPSTGQQWRVGWQVSSQMGVLPTELQMRKLPGGEWQDRAGDRWQMRWNQAPAELVGADFAWDHSVTATLSGLSQVAVSTSLSPRFVTPDGACTVYTAPFGPGAGGKGSVAVIGDSLIAQLVPGAGAKNSSPGPTVSPVPGATTSEPTSSITPTAVPGAPANGPLLAALRDRGYRVQIDGQGGRRWIAAQEQLDALELANGTMADELRGLREAGTVVVALGTNDANWSSLAPDDVQYQGRLSWTLAGLEKTLDELAQQGHCTVLLTMAARGKGNAGTPRGDRFELAAARINALMRQKADAEPRLALYDWGSQGDQHAFGTAQTWFGADTIHLSPAGISAYSRALSEAADLGCS
ncbi:GDSL-type esterase/lipase family protein [Kineosporia babensis]|uniref:GDSL-type esterase/lipase family protein n=1 Tax=Kineosporia babensis TaxID=499548 RepID=A0A9X1NEZ0_9ACTN|nr:GDSL-type esterase/lipase family protein [Kineosporia babensis]MCD5313877.1 GDSL-type esterase/lipase family protein [Kineosporia babensis]